MHGSLTFFPVWLPWLLFCKSPLSSQCPNLHKVDHHLFGIPFSPPCQGPCRYVPGPIFTHCDLWVIVNAAVLGLIIGTAIELAPGPEIWNFKVKHASPVGSYSPVDGPLPGSSCGNKPWLWDCTLIPQIYGRLPKLSSALVPLSSFATCIKCALPLFSGPLRTQFCLILWIRTREIHFFFSYLHLPWSTSCQLPPDQTIQNLPFVSQHLGIEFPSLVLSLTRFQGQSPIFCIPFSWF